MNKKNQKGYAILFTVVLVSIISLIAVGLSNTIYKQLLISSGAKDSQLAFFQSDMATECALYMDFNLKLNNGTTFPCGIDKNNNSYTLSVNKTGNIFSLLPSEVIASSSDPCFSAYIEQSDIIGGIATRILANGYNICNKTGLRAVERTIETNY
jgi:hypothetical protein